MTNAGDEAPGDGLDIRDRLGGCMQAAIGSTI